MRAQRVPQQSPSEREQSLLRRARRCGRKGEDRKAMVALREACFSAGNDARLWVLYGVHCWRALKRDEALRALRQGLWFRERNRDERRARVVRALIEQIESGAVGELRAA
jgi:Flp pilus assembly protein TadD